MITNTKFIAFFPEEIEEGKKREKLRAYVDNKKGYFFCKRIFDIVVSFIFIFAILSWFLPFIALFIKFSSPGPVFFLQRRVGRGGRTFICIKLRTMIVNLEADEKEAIENDYRITRIGKFLRESYLDEFPQFLNVLAGDMSIVGPRPHMHSDCRKFSSIVSGYKFRNFIRPGITGLAQVKDFHGPSIDHENIFRRYQWDAFYVRNAGFRQDLHIIRETAKQHIGFLFRVVTQDSSLTGTV